MKNIKIIIAAEVAVLVIVGFVMLGLFLSAGGSSNATLPPTPQPIILPTATSAPPTATPLAVAIPGKAGTEIVKQEDGTTKFIDYDALFEVTFPEGWLVVRPGSQEFQEALDNEGSKRPGLKSAMEAAQTDMDPNVERVLAYDLKPGSSDADMLGYIILTWAREDTASIEAELQQGIPQIEQNPEYQGKGLRVVSTDSIETGNLIKVGRIGMKWNLKNEAGEITPIYMPVNFFKVPQGMALLMLTTPNDFRPDVEPDFKAIVETIKYLGG